MALFLFFLLLILCSILFRVLVIGAKLQWLALINGTFLFIGFMVAVGLERFVGRLSIPVGLAVVLMTAIVAWKGIELLRGYAEDHLLFGGWYYAVRAFELLVVGAGPAYLSFGLLGVVAENYLALPYERVLVLAGALFVTGYAYYVYDLRFREKAVLRRRNRYFDADGLPLVYSEGSRIRP